MFFIGKKLPKFSPNYKKLPKTHPKLCENRLKISKVTKDRKTIENHRILLDNNYTYAALV